jgi:hypothetical protein
MESATAVIALKLSTLRKPLTKSGSRNRTQRRKRKRILPLTIETSSLLRAVMTEMLEPRISLLRTPDLERLVPRRRTVISTFPRVKSTLSSRKTETEVRKAREASLTYLNRKSMTY